MSEVNKIANYNQMMSWLTRPSTPKTETREKFYAGSSLEQFGSQIKDSWLSGKGTKEINKDLGFKNDKSTTIDSFIDSMLDPKIDTPINITKEEVKNRPGIIGTNQKGTRINTQERLKTFIETFEKKNNRLPSSKSCED